MIVIISFILAILSIVFWNKLERIGLELFGVVFVVVGCLFAIVAFITNMASLYTVSDMEAFYHRNVKVYRTVISSSPDTARVVTSESSMTIEKIPYILARKIEIYNEHLNWYRRYQDHWFIGAFVVDAPSELQFLEMQK